MVFHLSYVIPAKAGIQAWWHRLDSGFRRNDETKTAFLQDREQLKS
jgi:hypothetical protein